MSGGASRGYSVDRGRRPALRWGAIIQGGPAREAGSRGILVLGARGPAPLGGRQI